VKPFDTEELLARRRAAFRHKEGEAGARPLTAGGVEIDLEHRRVSRDGAEVHLSPKEYDVLAELARKPDRVITHAHLLRTIWGPAHLDRVDYLRIVVRNLRQKLEADPARPMLIRNEPGVGYRLIVR
jgi:two-component system KDP operon response regulator KdpE